MSETKLAPSGAQASAVPSYLECAQPNPAANRAPWFKNIAPVYVGIFLWFVFWSSMVTAGAANAGGILATGVGTALVGILAGAVICYALFYHVFGRFGQKTGMPLYIVGSSTFGAAGGLILPGFLMGLLQFGWVAVNVYGSTTALGKMLGLQYDKAGALIINPAAMVVMIIWGAAGVVMGLKGIKYVAMISTWLPIIPALTLLVLLFKTIGGLGSFDAAAMVAAAQKGGAAAPMTSSLILFLLISSIVGFTATAGAAGCDFGTNARNKKDVVMGGVVGVLLAIFITAGLATLIVAGFYGTPAGKELIKQNKVILDPITLLPTILGTEKAGNLVAFLLAICAFPSCCFSSIIAANAIKTTLPKVNPWISCGIGLVIAEALAISGKAGNFIGIFVFFGASFGPICGAMVADYFLNKGRWTGPRAGFNPAGWIAWAIGFAIGVQNQLSGWKPSVFGKPWPLTLIMAFFAGAIVYAVLSGMQSKVLPYPQADQQSAD